MPIVWLYVFEPKTCCCSRAATRSSQKTIVWNAQVLLYLLDASRSFKLKPDPARTIKLNLIVRSDAKSPYISKDLSRSARSYAVNRQIVSKDESTLRAWFCFPDHMPLKPIDRI